MHPTTRYQLAHAHTADLHQRAARERTAKAVIQACRARPHRRAFLGPGHAVTVLARVLTLAGGHACHRHDDHPARRRAVRPGTWE